MILTDDSPNPRQQPTKRNILDAMTWLVSGARKHDSLFFHCMWVNFDYGVAMLTNRYQTLATVDRLRMKTVTRSTVTTKVIDRPD